MTTLLVGAPLVQPANKDLYFSYAKNGNITPILDAVSIDPETEESLKQDFQ